MTDTTSTIIGNNQDSRDAKNAEGRQDWDDGDGAPKSKRRRTAIACTACRIRKSRCNGKRPRCSMCENLAFECVYEASGSTMSILVRKDYMSDVEARLQLLEAKVRKHEQLFETNERRLPGIEDEKAAPVQVSALHSDERHAHFHFNDGTAFRSAAVQELSPEEALTDGMAVSFIDEEDSGFFGQTSNISFMRHISRAMILTGSLGGLTSPLKSDDYALLDHGIVNVSRPASPNAGSSQRQPRESQHGMSLNSLPSETVTRELIELYFSNTGRLFPYIHEPTFMETYEQMKAANFTTVRRTWLGLLNMVLAMAFNANTQRHDQPAQERIAQSDVFYQRALGLCQTQILRGTSLETVQYLLLMSQYLQGTQKSVQTWAIHGLAVKAAYSVGLHSSDTSRTLSPIEREIRKRTWFGCVILDRTLSMTFGRPPAIPEDHVRLPFPQVLEDDSLNQASEKTRSVMFYNATITLYKIMARVISSLYGGNLGCDPPLTKKEMATKIFQIEQEIDEWNQALPDWLRLISSSSLVLNGADAPLSTKFRIILTLRCLNLQVLLYRPVLVRSIDQSTEDDAQPKNLRSMDQMQANHMQSCLASAKEVINIVHAVITDEIQGRYLLGAWWFSLYYVFNAALMIFGSLLASPKHNSASTNTISQIEDCGLFLVKAVQALSKLDEGNVTVQRCAHYLEQMSRSLESRRDTISGFLGEPGNSSLSKISNLERATNGGAHGASLLLNHQQSEHGNAGYTAAQVQVPTTNSFAFDSMYGSELELGQFFIGGGMEAWLDAQQ